MRSAACIIYCRRGHRQAAAFRRVGEVGVVEAMNDRRVARKLSRATHHASKAVVFSVTPPAQHRKRNAALIPWAFGTAAALLGGLWLATWAAWRYHLAHLPQAASAWRIGTPARTAPLPAAPRMSPPDFPRPQFP